MKLASDSSHRPVPNSNVFSALVELIGIHDIAEEDHKEFLEKTSKFQNAVANCRAQKDFSSAQFAWNVWIDQCFVQCSDPAVLVAFVARLRHELLCKEILCRAVVMEGACLTWASGPSTTSAKAFSEKAAFLTGRLARFKSAGIDIENSVRDTIVRRRKRRVETEDDPIFRNCYTTGEGSRQQLAEYWDHRWEIRTDSHYKIPLILKQIRHAHRRSRKAAKFYAPFLINLARNLPLDPKVDIRGVHEAFIDGISDSKTLEFLKRTPGGDLVALTLVDRFYSKKLASTLTSRLKSKLDWVFSARWIHDRLDSDLHGLPPDFIISPYSRGQYWKEVSTREEAAKAEDPDKIEDPE